jgi:GSH-dependent disulfide-bond oxidoreductase
MIDLYSAATMNGRRAAIALAECGLPHRVHLLDLQRGDQHATDFLELNPKGTIPVLVDHDAGESTPVTVMQSGAIVLYCAEKSGHLIPVPSRQRRQAFEWFAQALTDVGPASSVVFQMSTAPDQSEANVRFFEQRFLRHCSNVDSQLKGREYVVDEFSIADVALFPIIAIRSALINATEGLINLKSWRSRMEKRHHTAAAMAAHA